MKKILLFVVLFFGILPVVHQGRYSFCQIANVYADDFGEEEIPPIHQIDPATLPADDGQTTQPTPASCTFQALSVAISTLGGNVSVSDIANYEGGISCTPPIYLVINGINSQCIGEMIDKYCTSTDLTTSDGMRDAIANNHPVMALMNTSDPTNGHEVLITGYNDDHTFQYFDPASGHYSQAPGNAFNNPVAITGMK